LLILGLDLIDHGLELLWTLALAILGLQLRLKILDNPKKF